MVSIFNEATLGKMKKNAGNINRYQSCTPGVLLKRVSCVCRIGLCSTFSMGRDDAMEPKYWGRGLKRNRLNSVSIEKVTTNFFKHACYFVSLTAQ